MLDLLISPFSDPYLNLALENLYFDRLEEEKDLLFLYINDPAVVLGRFQNPWKECDPSALSCSLVRRQSGGGTVYHDKGNLNFSFIRNITAYDRAANLDMICKVMKGCGIKLSVNERHDLTADYKEKTYKVSGSAFRHKKEKAFHHGTLLIDCETSALKRAITPENERIFLKAAGTESKRSPVINLKRINNALDMEAVLECFRKYFTKGSPEQPEKGSDNDGPPPRGIIQKSPDEWEADKNAALLETYKLKSEEWIWGKTPAFVQDISRLHPPQTEGWTIKVNKGKIDSTPEELVRIRGLDYGRPDTEKKLKKILAGTDLFGLGENELFRRLILMIG